MATSTARSKSTSNHGPITARRIAQPGSFSKLIHQSYDDKLAAANSKLTPFQILNPNVDPNTPKIAPEVAAHHRKTRSADLAESSSSSTVNTQLLRSDRHRPTSAYIASRQKPEEEDMWEDPYGTPSPTVNRKCIVELEEELIAKTIQLQRLTLESEQSRKIYRATKQQMEKKIRKNEVLKQHLVNTIQVVREHMAEVEVAYTKTLTQG